MCSVVIHIVFFNSILESRKVAKCWQDSEQFHLHHLCEHVSLQCNTRWREHVSCKKYMVNTDQGPVRVTKLVGHACASFYLVDRESEPWAVTANFAGPGRHANTCTSTLAWQSSQLALVSSGGGVC